MTEYTQVHVKPGVHLETVEMPIYAAVGAVVVIFGALGLPVVITSARDGKHRDRSYHYNGLAIDVRTRIFTEEQKDLIHEALLTNLGAMYDVIFESRGQDNEHLHIEPGSEMGLAPGDIHDLPDYSGS